MVLVSCHTRNGYEKGRGSPAATNLLHFSLDGQAYLEMVSALDSGLLDSG